MQQVDGWAKLAMEAYDKGDFQTAYELNKKCYEANKENAVYMFYLMAISIAINNGEAEAWYTMVLDTLHKASGQLRDYRGHEVALMPWSVDEIVVKSTLMYETCCDGQLCQRALERLLEFMTNINLMNENCKVYRDMNYMLPWGGAELCKNINQYLRLAKEKFGIYYGESYKDIMFSTMKREFDMADMDMFQYLYVADNGKKKVDLRNVYYKEKYRDFTVDDFIGANTEGSEFLSENMKKHVKVSFFDKFTPKKVMFKRGLIVYSALNIAVSDNPMSVPMRYCLKDIIDLLDGEYGGIVLMSEKGWQIFSKEDLVKVYKTNPEKYGADPYSVK